jgi:hypothetical protein
MTRYDIILKKPPPVEITSCAVLEFPIENTTRIKYTAVTRVVDIHSFENWTLAVGIGIGGLDTFDVTPHRLFNEIARKKFDPFEFVDASGNSSVIPTNIVECSCTFLDVEAVGMLNEIGVFDDIENLRSYRKFDKINKTDSMSLTFQYRFYF